MSRCIDEQNTPVVVGMHMYVSTGHNGCMYIVTGTVVKLERATTSIAPGYQPTDVGKRLMQPSRTASNRDCPEPNCRHRVPAVSHKGKPDMR